MVAPSKLFKWPLNRVHCSRLLHSLPHQSCTHALLWNLYRNHVSSGQYYLPVLLFPILFKWRQLNQSTLLSILKHYAQTASFASCINAFTFYIMCIGRRLNGRYVCIFTPYASCWLASQLTWCMPPRVLQFYVTGITHAALEGLLRQWNVRLVHSRAAQTLIFMFCSLVILEEQREKRYAGFWFIKPSSLPVDYNKWTLLQRSKQALKELRAYLGIGLSLDVLNCTLRGRPWQLHWKSTSFMVSYMAIFKSIQCLFADMLTMRHMNLLAAFLSGSAYALLNRFNFMSFAVIIAIQVLWQKFCCQRPGNLLQRIPWSKLLIPFNLAYLVHSFFFQPHVVNGLAKDFINCTCDRNAQRLYNFLKLADEKIILTKVTKTMPTAFI